MRKKKKKKKRKKAFTQLILIQIGEVTFREEYLIIIVIMDCKKTTPIAYIFFHNIDALPRRGCADLQLLSDRL